MTHDPRTALINGLLELAAFLEANPSVPVTKNVIVNHFPRHLTDAEMCAEIDQIAARVGSTIDQTDLPHGHYATSRFFGPVEYRAVAVLATARARHAAHSSYHGCIQPDNT
ncbi:hypothetical protein [Nonomuraea sp. B1E8]|uniref:hypothetical protein n=1 Tax=unclassified Nonomuraea TaxID=2593643 RepID=UPI00325F0976